jgi:hypothetical protein
MATKYLEQRNGRLHEVEGKGQLVICVPSLGDLAANIAFLPPC